MRASFRMLRLLASMLLLSLGLALVALAQTAPGPARLAVVLEIDGAIGPASADYLRRGLAEAAQRDARLVIIRMDTPGGLDTSMREMIRDILASPVPVATFVTPSGARAASAGTYILYASHVAAMTPGTNLGAATPVAVGGGGFPGQEPERENGERPQPGTAAERKAINDAVAFIRGLAAMRERNVEWAEQAVREAASLPAREALELNVIDVVAKNLDDLLAQLHGRTVMVRDNPVVLDTENLTIEHIEPDWRTRLLAAITNPNVALILMMIGVYGLIFEFMNPGALVPGTIGAISLLIGLYALAVLPVNYAGLGLMVLGLGLMVAEGVTPSFGILGVGGAIAFILGATILIDTDIPGLQLYWPVIAGVGLFSLGFSMLVVRAALKSRRAGVVQGREHMIGGRARVQDWSGSEGHVAIEGERWSAVSDQPLVTGQRVRVVGLDGLTLTVVPEPADKQQTEQQP